MGETYTVSRGELLSWINSTLDLRLGKIEETANGAVVCQLLDALFAGTVPLKKVDYNAKNEYDMIGNYKVMQDVFNKLGIDKHVDVSKLMKGRPLDNMEFMQWFKAYWDAQTGGQTIDDYDPVARRQLCKTGNVKGGGGGAAAAAPSAGSLPQQRRAAPPSYSSSKGAVTPPPGAAAAGGRSKRSLITAGSAGDDALERLQAEVATWRGAAETCTKEKDFYYSKLRAIELLCNTPGITGHPVAKAVEDILYAATTEEGEQSLAVAIAELEIKNGAEQQQQQQQEQQAGTEQQQQQEEELPHSQASFHESDAAAVPVA